MSRAIKVIQFLLMTLLTGSFLLSCSESGVQGGSLFSRFQGVDVATALSPTTVQLTWGLDSKYSEYRIYENSGSTPIKSETFGVTRITGLQPNTTYNYQISGYSALTGEKFGDEPISIATLPRFTGVELEGITLRSSTEMRVSWTMNSETAKYRVHFKNQTGTWNKSIPIATVTADNTANITGLTAGQTYCFFIEAEYLDGSIEPIATTENELNAASKCKQLTTVMPSVPSLAVNSVTLGDFPWFWSANGDPTYKIDIYDSASNLRVASRTGNGYFRATVPISPDAKTYYGVISNVAGDVSTTPVDIVGSQTKTVSKTRKPTSTGMNGAVFPPILSGGKGPQNLGSEIVGGDFNCDGLPDFAAAAKSSVPVNTVEHYKEIGSVIVYYTYEYIEEVEGVPTIRRALKTDVAPTASAAAPNPQLIYFPVSADLTQFGTKLTSGNYNGDCYQTDFVPSDVSPLRGSCDLINTQFPGPSKTPAKFRQVKKCDDLAVTTATGNMFVVYGDPTQGLVSGSGTNTFGIDEQTCDSVSSTCRAARYSTPAGYTAATFGSALASGDFNNDGFDDIATVAAATADGIKRVLIYRGDSLGIVPSGNIKSFAVVNPADGSTGLSVPERITSAADNFGFSITAVPNSRLCELNSPAGAAYRNTSFFPTAASQRIKGLEVSKCADLVIGAPNRATNRGSIYTCRGSQPTSGDKSLIQSWACKEHYPNAVSGESPINYGYSVLGVANQNGYPIGTNIIGGAAQPNIWGALFVGAPGSTVSGVGSAGSVYGYYVTKSNGENYQWGIQTQIGGAIAHNVLADNSIACDQTNSTCLHQRITPAALQGGMQFGYKLSSVNERAGTIDKWMPILAVTAPFRDNINSSGQTVADSGAIYMYRGDISNFMNRIDGGTEITEPIYNPLKLTPCSDGNCTWLSGGISPFGATLLYEKSLGLSSNFGIGGAVGVSDLANYSFDNDTATDLFVTAPFSNTPTPNNGGIYGFFSSAGSFSPTVNERDLEITTNISLEGNYDFDQARIVGDINGDGYDDVMSHINSNGNWILVIYYGSASGLVRNALPSYSPIGLEPKLYKSTIDKNLGEQFFPAGDVNADGFADVIIFSSLGSGTYIFYGSSSGLVTSAEPDIAPVGKNPLRFAVGGANTVSFSISTLQGSLADDVSYNSILQAVTYGKFNNDIYDDIVIRSSQSYSLPVAAQDPSSNYSGSGRVFILYGSPTGPKINSTTGRILLQDTFGNPADVLATNPCSAVSVSDCKVQMIAPPVGGSVGFGFAIAKRSLYNSTTQEMDGLLVSAPRFSVSTGRVYVYEGDLRGLKPGVIQALVPRDTGTYWGYSVVDVGDINGDQKTDVAISGQVRPATSTRGGVVTIFYGASLSGKSAYAGDPTQLLNGINYWGAPAIADNQSTTNLRPQIINPINAVSSDFVGYGLTGLGDFNNDGFADLAINVSNGDYNISGTVSTTGFVLIYFGSANGMQTASFTPTPYPKCHAGGTTQCEPYQIYLPGYAENDFTQISPHSSGDVNGDSIVDLIIGAEGRSHPSGLGISTGVFHVVY